MKPVETGCPARRGIRVPRDGAFLRFMAGTNEPLEEVVPYRFSAPLAPQAAAAREGRRVSLARIRRAYRDLASRYDLTLVEGAGGLLVPLNTRSLMLDLILDLELPVLLVGRLGLGTLNHTLLTLECLVRNRVPVVGIVLNNPDGARGLPSRTNPQVLRAWTSVPLLGSIPHAPGLRPVRSESGRAARLVEEHVRVEGILRALRVHAASGDSRRWRVRPAGLPGRARGGRAGEARRPSV
jgi:dethiobiotin synthetase